jgi:hypothetical protein
MDRKSVFKGKWTALGAFVVAGTASLIVGTVSAQPSCEWDCTTTDCCSPGIEKPCNGGTYGAFCPDACIGAGAFEMPFGTCPY